MIVLITAIAFLLLLSLLVMIHEWGHYIVAKKAGVIVEEFGFGIPPRATTLFTYDGTKFSLNWIPFGGFVRLRGENIIDENQRYTKGNFAAASIRARCAILIAGVVMNLLLALVIFTMGFRFAHWLPTYVSIASMQQAEKDGDIAVTWGAYIQGIVPGSPADSVALQAGSFITAVDGVSVGNAAEVLSRQKGHDRVTYRIRFADDELQEEDMTIVLENGKTGVALSDMPLSIETMDRGWWDALRLSFREAHVVTVETIRGVGHLFASLANTHRVPDNIAGIIGIAELTHARVQEGWMAYLRLVAILSLSLAVLNIVPFPSLDGGRLLFVLIEGITRRPLHRHVEQSANTIGFLLLLLLLVVITINDIVRLF